MEFCKDKFIYEVYMKISFMCCQLQIIAALQTLMLSVTTLTAEYELVQIIHRNGS